MNTGKNGVLFAFTYRRDLWSGYPRGWHLAVDPRAYPGSPYHPSYGKLQILCSCVTGQPPNLHPWSWPTVEINGVARLATLKGVARLCEPGQKLATERLIFEALKGDS